MYPSFDSAIQSMVKYEGTFEPSPQNAAIYRELYHRVYRKIYPALQPLYEQIREITGYPEKVGASRGGA
jgi:sugar (pentulose or hexulose) kinase